MPSQTLSSADRIRELAAINADVAAMLQSAAHAITSLAPAAGDPTATKTASTLTMGERKEAFTQHTDAYYTGLQSIVARLRRQAYALEEAGIIAPVASVLTSNSQPTQSASPTGLARAQTAAIPLPEVDRITNGGLGSLDVGWLNSRGNKAGVEKEAEVMEHAEQLLDHVLADKSAAD